MMISRKTIDLEIRCPYCKGNNIIERGTAKRKDGSVQVYGCKDCKKRFTFHDGTISKKGMTIQLLATVKELEKTITKISDENSALHTSLGSYRLRTLELEELNKTLLDNNVKLASENERLVAMTESQHSKILIIEKEKTDCKQKCEVVISEKDRRIHALEEYKAGCKTTFERLKNGRWLYQVKQNPDNSIDIIHTVHPA